MFQVQKTGSLACWPVQGKLYCQFGSRRHCSTGAWFWKIADAEPAGRTVLAVGTTNGTGYYSSRAVIGNTDAGVFEKSTVYQPGNADYASSCDRDGGGEEEVQPGPQGTPSCKLLQSVQNCEFVSLPELLLTLPFEPTNQINADELKPKELMQTNLNLRKELSNARSAISWPGFKRGPFTNEQ